MRAVLDPNVVISALLSSQGTPARILRDWEQGTFELIISPLLLDELERALTYPKLRRHIPAEEATAVLQWLTDSATMLADPIQEPPVRSHDRGDDYLISLAAAARAILISGDKHLLDLSHQIPVFAPPRFLETNRAQ
ncbi:MAG: putative toxin-antitoxin system toxin component, PIN family [Actinomycetota bacterium]|nr:putative toxin-antitoxin system toxin component, PIN family [Actinomycetota bacterium]